MAGGDRRGIGIAEGIGDADDGRIELLLPVATILNAIAPLFARLTQVAVSREREYLADATAVEPGRNPAALEGPC